MWMVRVANCGVLIAFFLIGCGARHSPMDADADLEIDVDIETDSLQDAEACDECGCVIQEDMSCIPEGPFLMGEIDGDPEAPIHEVYLSTYYIDRTEVTNSAYRVCVAESVCTPPANPHSYLREYYYSDPEYDDFPVIGVTWDQANEFCEWAGKRLPTEAEWEKAARGGCSGAVCDPVTDTSRHPWGDENTTCLLANAAYECGGDTHAGGSLPGDQSPYGVFDMAGNVTEYTNDWYRSTYYGESPYENPPGPSVEDARNQCDLGTWKVSRGLSFLAEGLYHSADTITERFERPLNNATVSTSFRCALDISF